LIAGAMRSSVPLAWIEAELGARASSGWLTLPGFDPSATAAAAAAT
jgi:hypothetical protein